MGREAAERTLDPTGVDQELVDSDILTNCRFFPKAGGGRDSMEGRQTR